MVQTSPRRLALSTTLHCLTGCSIGEALGMALGSSLDWAPERTIPVSVALAFLFGYALTMRPLLRAGRPFAAAARLAVAADTGSIAVMEVVDNAVMLLLPGAMDAPVTSARFWASLGISLIVAGAAAYPLNLWLVGRGGQGAVHAHHGAHHGDAPPGSR